MTDECYWNYPLKGKDGRTENGSKKYRDYYFEKNGNITCQEIADYFKVSESVIKGHKSNYEWDNVLSDKNNYIKRKRAEKREQQLDLFKDKDYKNVINLLNGHYKLVMLAYMFLGLMDTPPEVIIPDWLTESRAVKIVMANPLSKLHNQILTDLDYIKPVDEKELERNTPPLAEAFKKETLMILEHSKYDD